MRRARAVASLALALRLLAPGVATAQEEESSVPDVPSGEAVIAGRVEHPDPKTSLGDLPVVLYSLGSDGPGLREGRTDASGHFRFEGVSGSPDVVYLVGARYRDVPFGRRAVFSADQHELDVTIPVSDPVSGGQPLRVRESEVRVDWVGASLVVQEIHRVENSGHAVVYVPPKERGKAKPAFSGALPEGASDFGPSLGTFGESLEQRGGRVLYWGPLYPGSQEIGFHYEVAAKSEGSQGTLPLHLRFPSGAERLSVLSPESAPPLSIAGMRAADSVERDGRRYRVLEAEDLAPGATFAGRVALPELSRDPSALSLPRADLWVEFDDTALLVSQEQRFQVEGNSLLVGSADAPLLHLELPPGARFLGIDPEAAGLGVAPSSASGLDVLGPLPPGESSFAFRYRVPVENDAGRLAIHFPKQVAVLNLLIADTGVVVQDERMHRRRPFHSGTRNYLHREAFQVEPSETVEVAISPLRHAHLPQRASLAVVLLAALAGVAFLIGPLRPSPGAGEASDERAASRARERENAIESLRDLEHDFETGKIAAPDYERMREELRARALDLLREERDAARGAPPAQAAAAPAPPPREAAAAEATRRGSAPPSLADAPTQVVSLCPACRRPIDEDWRFCSHCGAPLGPEAERESVG